MFFCGLEVHHALMRCAI